MRIPGFMLTDTISVELLEGTTARGETFAAPANRAAHVEERSALRVDDRSSSETAGTIVTMNVQIIVQLDRTVTPGSRVVWLGRPLTVANVAHLEHPHAPSNTEMWCV